MKIKLSVARNLLNFCLKEDQLQETKLLFEQNIEKVSTGSGFVQEPRDLGFYRPLTSACYHNGRLLGCDGYRWIAVQVEEVEEEFQHNNAYITIERQGLLNAWMRAAEQSEESIDVHRLITEFGVLLPSDNIFAAVDTTETLQEILIEDEDKLTYVNARGLLQLLELIVSADLDDSCTVAFIVLGSEKLGILFRARGIQGYLMTLESN